MFRNGIIKYSIIRSSLPSLTKNLVQPLKLRTIGSNTGFIFNVAGNKTNKPIIFEEGKTTNVQEDTSGRRITSGNVTDAIKQSRELIQRSKEAYGIPGITVAVSIDGKSTWSEAFGYSDLENQVPCREDTVMRIASISKPITTTAAAKLWQEGQLDLDKSILEYIKDYPQPKFEGKNVTITPRQLVSNLSGIRHYTKPSPDGTSEGVVQYEEAYNTKPYENVRDAIKVIENEPLLFKPGEKYSYSSYGFNVLSAVIENIVKDSFKNHMDRLFETLGMDNTSFDVNDTLTYNRSRYYTKQNGFINNSRYIDSSLYWAGGGIQSTVGDLVKFGNIMLYCYQDNENTFLNANTVKKLWEPTEQSQKGRDFAYGMGWAIIPYREACKLCKLRKFAVLHDGLNSGATSVLMIQPSTSTSQMGNNPHGIVVSILANCDQGPLLIDVAKDIVQNFDKDTVEISMVN